MPGRVTSIFSKACMHDLYVKMQFYDSATNELVYMYIRKQIGAFIEILY